MSCILIRYTYDNNLEMIQPLVQELYHFLCIRFWPPGGQAKNQTGANLPIGIYVQGFKSKAPAVRKCALLTDEDGPHVIDDNG
jgi:hypothetical protein